MPEERKAQNPELTQQHTALFASLVAMLHDNAMQMMGKITNPFSGATEHNMEAAMQVIALLEMFEAKTEGNRTKEEDALIKQALGNLHLTFVEELQEMQKRGESPNSPLKTQLSEEGNEIFPETSKKSVEPSNSASPPPKTDSPASEEPRKRFTKKYE